MIAGTVTISLKDYHDLLENKKKSETLRANTERAAKEIAVFLSFMATRKDIEPYVQTLLLKMEEPEYNSKMLRTKFVTKDLDELVFLMHEFEEKLTAWQKKNVASEWNVVVFIGEDEYIIEVTVEGDDTEETK